MIYILCYILFCMFQPRRRSTASCLLRIMAWRGLRAQSRCRHCKTVSLNSFVRVQPQSEDVTVAPPQSTECIWQIYCVLQSYLWNYCSNGNEHLRLYLHLLTHLLLGILLPFLWGAAWRVIDTGAIYDELVCNNDSVRMESIGMEQLFDTIERYVSRVWVVSLVGSLGIVLVYQLLDMVLRSCSCSFARRKTSLNNMLGRKVVLLEISAHYEYQCYYTSATHVTLLCWTWSFQSLSASVCVCGFNRSFIVFWSILWLFMYLLPADGNMLGCRCLL
jgi:hypothetical protein